jgi:hypothetical protein
MRGNFYFTFIEIETNNDGTQSRKAIAENKIPGLSASISENYGLPAQLQLPNAASQAFVMSS